ncbi:MAG: flagellar hook-associated protein 3, partial [Bdellovibrionales bacterium]|nr:flagellar hook-associated protein 3 [Bdellovibrionales bacterium]
MRIADKMSYDQVMTNVGKNRRQMSELQNQAATQKRVTKPSDDPLAATRVLGEKVDLSGKQQFTKSLNYAKSFLEFTDQSLSEVSELFMRAKDLALSQANDASANEESRRVVATEIEQLYSQMVQVGNRKMGDRFIFGGYKTTSSPFKHDGSYQGDDGELLIHVDKDAFISMNLPGSRIFLGEGFGGDGVSMPSKDQPRTIEDFIAGQANQTRDKNAIDPNAPSNDLEAPVENELSSPEMRGPASELDSLFPENLSEEKKGSGAVNLFSVLKGLEISLKANDKEGVQDSLNDLDTALSQVVLARAQVGSRA